MKAMLTFLLVIGFSFDIGHKCDSYFVGNVLNRQFGHGVYVDESATIQGCKKGCYNSGNFTEDGVPKCGKCSEIKDENECLGFRATCQWSSGGKCTSQSCPNIAKSRVTLLRTFVEDIRESAYRDRILKETECFEGSALEKKYNSLYINDYKATHNFQYVVWNLDETCTVPGSSVGGYQPYSWNTVVQNGTSTDHQTACLKYIGYEFTAGTNPTADQCTRIDCTTANAAANIEVACNAIEGCIYITNPLDLAGSSTGRCEEPTAGSCYDTTITGFPRWVPGTNTAAECTKIQGCVYRRGEGSQGGSVEDRPYLRDEDGLSREDQCVPGCTGFTPGTSTRKDCEVLGCTYTGYDDYYRPGVHNLRKFQDADLCPANNHPPTGVYTHCGENATLSLSNDDQNTCNDRIYDDVNPYSCSLNRFTTEESCKNAHGTWTAPPWLCRELPSTTRSKCEFDIREKKDQIVYDDLKRHGGNQRPGTIYEYCVQTHYDELDSLKTETVVGYDGESRIRPAYLTLDDHEKIYGYRTPEDYCKFLVDREVTEQCQKPYDFAVNQCHNRITAVQVKADDWVRDAPIQVKADRSACHRIYGCMYSKSNERCSVWAVWAFILILVLTGVVFLAGAVVGGIVLARVFGLSSA